MTRKTICVNEKTWQKLAKMSKNITAETDTFTSIGYIIDFMVNNLSRITEDMMVRRLKPQIHISKEEMKEIFDSLNLKMIEED